MPKRPTRKPAAADEARDVAAIEAHYHRLVQTTPQTIFALDAEGRFTELNPAGEELLGRPAAELIGRRFDEVFDPENLAVATREFERLISGATEIVDTEVQVQRSDGELRLVHGRLAAVRDNGAIVGAHGIARDITEERRAQELIEESERSYLSLFDSLTELVCIMDLDGRFRAVNEALLARTGYTRDELIGAPPERLAANDAEERLTLARHFRAAIAGRPQRLTMWAKTKSGERFPAEMSLVRGRHFGDDVVIAVGQDITERQAADEALKSAEAHYRRLVENSPYGIYVLDSGGRFTEINTAGTDILGRTADEVIGRSFAEVILPEDLPKAAASLERRLCGDVEPSELEVRIVRPSADVRLLHIRAAAICDEHGTVIGTHGVARDITEDVRNQQQLRRAERLATVGTLIGGVAHELNNPLQAISNFASLLLEDAHTQEEREDLQTIRREAARAARIVADLRLLARNTQDVLGERTRVDLNDIVRHVLRTRRHSLTTHGIEVREDLADELPPVRADSGDMEQVLINLIVNAEQALAQHTDRRTLIVRTRATGTGVALSVVDNGPGIPRESLDQIFDPFFTTKSRAEGTGLGLSLVHKIITEHDGDIAVESEVGRGAAFRIHLPAARDGAPPRAEAEAAAPESAVRPLRILVVEDEAAIRSAISRFLRRRGHHVDVAAEGGEALRMLDSGNGSYDVILSDLRMPGLGGEQLLARLRARGGGLDRRVMFLTGEAASGNTARLIAECAAPVIFKPIGLGELAQRIEQYVATI